MTLAEIERKIVDVACEYVAAMKELTVAAHGEASRRVQSTDYKRRLADAHDRAMLEARAMSLELSLVELGEELES